MRQQARALNVAEELNPQAGAFMRAYWWAIVLGGVAALFLLTKRLESPQAKLAWDRRVLRLPVVGDEVSVPGWRISVAGMDGRRVERLRFTPADPLPAEPTRAEHGGDQRSDKGVDEETGGVAPVEGDPTGPDAADRPERHRLRRRGGSK